MVHNRSLTSMRRQLRGYRVSPVQGAFAGFTGTIPMTVFMLMIHRLLPKWQQYALPPQQITDELEERAGVERYMNTPARLGVALASHFGYGATMGILYGLITGKIPLPVVLKGMFFALFVWAASYLGWLPLARFSAAATKQTLSRNLMMIVAHLIWGTVTAKMTDQL